MALVTATPYYMAPDRHPELVHETLWTLFVHALIFVGLDYPTILSLRGEHSQGDAKQTPGHQYVVLFAKYMSLRRK